MPKQNDSGDAGGEEITLDGQATGAAPSPAPAEDRGDIVNPELSRDNLQQVLANAGDDGGGDDDGAGDGEASGGQPADKPQYIPKARFDEVNNKKKDLEARLEETQRQLDEARRTPAPPAPAATPAAPAAPTPPAPPPFDEEAAEEAYAEALLEGDTKKAAGIRRTINDNIRAAAEQAAETRITARQVVQDVDAVAAQAVKDYPYLDTPEGQDAMDAIVALRDAKMRAGTPAVQALQEAVNKLAPKFAPADSQDSTTTPGAGDTPSRDLPGQKGGADTRTATALARGAKDSTQQPPNLAAGVGNRPTAGTVNVADMSEEQFAALSPAEKKRLRGD